MEEVEQRKKARIRRIRESKKLKTKNEGLDSESKKNNNRAPYSKHYVFSGPDNDILWSLELPLCSAARFSQYLCNF